MKRLTVLCIALVAIALISAPAFAEVQNVKVSGDVNTSGVYRENYTLLSTNVGTSVEENNFITTQARVSIDADLTDNVSTTIRFLTEYDWNTGANTSAAGDDVDLDLANVTLKEVFYAPLTVTVGRQELRLGNAFVIGDPDTNTTSADAGITATDLSLRKSFDAVKAVFDFDPLVVDVIYAKITESNGALTDEDLYGINASYDVGANDAEIEAYWFWNDNDASAGPFAIGTTVGTLRSGNSIHTIGARGSVTPIDNLNLSGEFAVQTGDYDSEAAVIRDQDAVAYQIAADYSLSDIAVSWTNITLSNPVVRLGWTHYDGEEVANLGDHSAWIPLYEDQSHGVVANFILGGVNGGQNSNADILNLGASVGLLEDLTVSLDWYQFWLDENLVAGNNDLASTNGALGWRNLTEGSYYMYADDDLGFELDLVLDYDYSEDVDMGLSIGWFSPGDAWQGASTALENAETALQVLATLDVAF